MNNLSASVSYEFVGDASTTVFVWTVSDICAVANIRDVGKIVSASISVGPAGSVVVDATGTVITVTFNSAPSVGSHTAGLELVK